MKPRCRPPDRELRGKLVTTSWVLMEVGDALSSPAVRQRTHTFLRKVTADSNTTIVSDLDPWFWHGLDLFGNRPDKDWSLTDCISFTVMIDRGLTDALTGDHHFVQAGFRLLLPPIDS